MYLFAVARVKAPSKFPFPITLMSHPKLRFHVQLEYLDPLIWRRFEVPAGLTFADLHLAIQGAMGWYNAHLHQFTVGDTLIARQFEDDFPGEENILDHEQAMVQDFLADAGQTMRYLYDFGDSWEHQLTFEGRVEGTDDAYRVLAGERACPPEDCGGFPGYLGMLEALADPAHPDHDDLQEWLEEDEFDPAAFSVEEAQAHLQHMMQPSPMDEANIAGFPVLEMEALLQRPFAADSPLQVNPKLDPDLLAVVPQFDLALRLMGLLEASDGLKATATAGNLPRKAVRDLYEQSLYTFKYIESGDVKLNKETDLSVLHSLRLCLEMAGLMRKYRGKFVLTKRGKQLYAAPAQHGELFTLLADTYATRFNLGFFDHYPDDYYGQWGLGFSLLMLRSYGQEIRSADWYNRHYWPLFVTLMGEPQTRVITYGENNPIRESGRTFEARFLNRYAELLGLVSIQRPEGFLYDLADVQVKSTELLRLWLPAELPDPGGWQAAAKRWWETEGD